MNAELGNELYQDTMMKLLEKRRKLNSQKNIKSYAISTAVLLWKNKKKVYARRKEIADIRSLEQFEEEGIFTASSDNLPEEELIRNEELSMVKVMVSELPDKLRIPIELYYASDMKLDEIAECLGENINTIKTRMRKAKDILRKKLEERGYD